MADIEGIFAAVRESASKGVWSRGVALVREDAVSGDSESGEVIRFRVRDKQSRVSPKVSLFPADEDWTCDCPSEEDPCQHVAAAVIALKRAREAGEALPKGTCAAGRIQYGFHVVDDDLELRRMITGDGPDRPLEGALSSLVQRADFPVAATQEDLQIDLALSAARGRPSPTHLRAVFKALAAVEGVTLDGKPIAVSGDPMGARIVVVDEGPGCRVYGEQDPRIDRVYKNGAVKVGGVLHPVHVPDLSPKESEIITSGRYFAPVELSVLASEVLPALREKLPVVVRSTQLPAQGFARPRLEILTVTHGDTLRIEPRIAYGDPVVARIVQGRLVQVGPVVPARDQDEEWRLKDRLWQELGLELDRPLELSGEAAVRMVTRLARWQGDVTGGGVEDFAPKPPLTVKVRFADDGFDLEFKTVDGKDQSRRAKAQDVLAAWQTGESLVRLEGGGFAPLPAGWLDAHGDMVLDLLAAREGRESLPRASLPLLASFAEELGERPPPGLEKWRERILGFETLPVAALPEDLGATLRDYQMAGVSWLAFHRELGTGCLLADDMGLGKTLQAACLLGPGSLVVAPTSVVENWRREIERFRPSLSVNVYHGSGRRLDARDVTLTTYAVLRLDLEALSARHWQTVVLDEAHTIKNPESQAAQAAWSLNADYRIALSGTPVENRLSDLWSQMHFLNPGFLGSLRHFRETYAKKVAAGDQVTAERLRRRLKPFLLRRRKDEVARELPPRTDVVRWVELNEHERTVYDAVRAAARKDVLQRLGAGGSVFEALEALLRLRQAACHPGLLPGRHETASSKLESLLEILEMSLDEGHKALVFTQWTSFLDLIEKAVAEAGWRHLRLDGSTRDRQAVVDQFQDPDGPRVLIMSLKAGGVGLNLTAADHVILADPWWNPAAEDQAADRAHRIGQDRPVMVHRLVSKETVEEGILALQDAKRQLAREVVSAGGGSALTRDDLMSLLEG